MFLDLSNYPVLSIIRLSISNLPIPLIPDQARYCHDDAWSSQQRKPKCACDIEEVGARQIQVSMTFQNTPRTNWMIEKGLSRHQTQYQNILDDPIILLSNRDS